jgi:phage anti-repressor protein
MKKNHPKLEQSDLELVINEITSFQNLFKVSTEKFKEMINEYFICITDADYNMKDFATRDILLHLLSFEIT